MSVSRYALTFILLVFTQLPALGSETGLYLLSRERGVQVSSNNGTTWHSLNDGLPENCVPTRITPDRTGRLYLLTLQSGLFVLPFGGEEWLPLNDDAFLVRGMRGRKGLYRKLTAIATDPADARHLALGVKHYLFESRDSGKTWKKISPPVLDGENYYTALCIDPKNGAVYAGTSFNGIYRFANGSYTHISRGLPREPYSDGVFFYEEVASLSLDETSPHLLWAGHNFGGGLYVSSDSGLTWREVPLAGARGMYCVYGMMQCGDYMMISTSAGAFRVKRADLSVSGDDTPAPAGSHPRGIRPVFLSAVGVEPPYPSRVVLDAAPGPGKKPDARAGGRKALYAGAPGTAGRTESIITTLSRCGMNAVVIDMKDDLGYLNFSSSNAVARETGAVRRKTGVREMLKRYKEAKVYTIARCVVFKDRALFRAYDGKYAIRNALTGAPWRGSPNEHWVDPHSDFVMRYNIAIALELQEAGFDEIQFDYIRFPSDGPTRLCRYAYRGHADMFKSEAITDFLALAKAHLSVPVSVDIYGFNACYRFGNRIGQDIEELSRVADVICPMVYPSHFGTRYLRRLKGNEHPYRIVMDSGKRAHLLAGKDVLIRPYLQAFRMLSPTWGPGYIRSQIAGAEDGSSSGYTFWNAAVDYSMLVAAALKAE
jgi:hypothetical protein